jgi:hypothetical protein
MDTMDARTRSRVDVHAGKRALTRRERGDGGGARA